MNYADQNLSSAKTVTAENTNEKENEQASTAQVINQLNNEDIVMEETASQNSMAPQAGACETALGNAEDTTVNRTELTTEVNNDAEQMDVSTAVVLLTLLGDKLTKRVVKYSISYLEAKAGGLKVAFFKANRHVNANHTTILWKSVKDSKRFANGCHVVPLRPILEKFNNIEVYDLDGNQITLDTPDLDMYVAVYDGQHRITVCEYHSGEVDVDLDLNEFDGRDPLKVIKDMNFYSRNWNGQDLRDSNVNSGISTNRLYEEAKILQERYGITPKLAEFIITFIADATKKRDLIEGKDTTMYNEDNAKRGIGIFEAYIANFDGDKVAKKMELMTAVVYTHTSVSDEEKPTFARMMKIFMGIQSVDELDKIKKFITNKDFGKLNETIKQGYEAFCKLGYSEEELDEMERELDNRIAAYVKKIDELNQKKVAKKTLKSGRVSDIINQIKAVQYEIDKENLATAELDAKIAFMKAQEAQKRVDELKAKNSRFTSPDNIE